MSKLKIIRKTIIKDLDYSDIDAILSLINDEYGNNYSEKEFYSKDQLEKYIKRTKETRYASWKGAFFEDNLIGMMLAIVDHGCVFLKSTIVKENFRGNGIVKLLTFHIQNLLKFYDKSDFKSIYAMVDNDNESMKRHIINYQYIEVGTTPSWDVNKYFIIFCRITYDHAWKLIEPSIRITPFLHKIIRKTKLKRFISTSYTVLTPLSEEKIYDKLKMIENESTEKVKIFWEKKCLAQLYYNYYQKSQYDFMFVGNNSIGIKREVVKYVIDRFDNNEKFNSLSFSIDVNDRQLQEFLLKVGMKPYAFLPFYLNKKDVILMGKSKKGDSN